MGSKSWRIRRDQGSGEMRSSGEEFTEIKCWVYGLNINLDYVTQFVCYDDKDGIRVSAAWKKRPIAMGQCCLSPTKITISYA